MSKKMMRRTAALSALIAISLSGTVMAANVLEQDTVISTGVHYHDGFGSAADAQWDLGSNELWIDNDIAGKGHAVKATGYSFTGADGSSLKIEAGEGKTVSYGLAFYGEVDVDSLSIKADNNAVQALVGETKITANEVTLTSNNESGIAASESGSVNIASNKVTINAGNHGITAFAGGKDVTVTADEVTIKANGGAAINSETSSTITVDASKSVTLNGDVESKGSGGTINVDGGASAIVNGDVTSKKGTVTIASTGDTTINGSVIAGYEVSDGKTEINIDGKNINIDGNGSFGVTAWSAYYANDAEVTVNLGSDQTETINITNASYGIMPYGNGTEVTIDADALNITDTTYGVWVANRSVSTGDNLDGGDRADDAKLIIGADTDVTMTDVDYGIISMSQGTVDIAGNLKIEANDAAIDTRGEAVTKINAANDPTKTVQIDGDIVFDYDDYKVDSDVIINLANADSYLNGNIYNTGGGIVPDGEVTGMALGLSDGATWTADEDSFVNDLTMNDGNIVMAGEGQTITVDNLLGEGGSVTTESLNNQMIVNGEVERDFLNVYGSEAITAAFENDENADLNTYLMDLADTAIGADGETIATNIELAEGALLGATSATVGENGVINVVTKENKANAGLIDMTALSFMAWRGENDDLNERLGDLRNAKQERGIWTRMSRAEQSFNTVTNQYNMYQIGYDQQAGDWTLGAAYSYTDGKSWFEKGTGENTHNVFSLYGTKMNDNGTFVDLVAKYGNLDYDYDIFGGVGGGSYDTDAYSFSVETGKRITSSNGVWVEPQLQLTYGTVDDVAFKTKNGYSVNMDSADSFVARAGIMAGKPVHKGNIYLKASYLYDFAGEVEGTFSNANGRSVDISRDLGGGWWEVGAGANFNLSDATHLYLDFEKAVAGEAEVEWKWNAGVRYSF